MRQACGTMDEKIPSPRAGSARAIDSLVHPQQGGECVARWRPPSASSQSIGA